VKQKTGKKIRQTAVNHLHADEQMAAFQLSFLARNSAKSREPRAES